MFIKSQSHSINDTFMRISKSNSSHKNRDIIPFHTASGHFYDHLTISPTPATD